MAAFADATSGFTPAADWIDANVWDWTSVTNYQGVYDYTTARKIKLLQYQRDILNVVLTPYPCECLGTPIYTANPMEIPEGVPLKKVCENHRLDRVGKFPYDSVIWSQPKKHGKTQTCAAVASWFAVHCEPPNLLMTLASNQEQSAGLIFNSLVPTMYAVGGKVPNTTTSTPIIRLPNGTVIRAIPNNYAGQAGGNQGFTGWSELWTYKSERDRRLWEEMPPVPTRWNSIRWVETYAGFEDESELLIDQFSRVFGHKNGEKRIPDFTEREIQENAVPVPGLEHIRTGEGDFERPCCYHIPEEGFFMFWDHEIRAHRKDGGWITDQYIAKQKAENRHTTFVRLWENRWQSSIGTFLEPHLVDRAVTVDEEEWGEFVLAGDASQRNDHTALVGVQKYKVKLFGKEQERYRVMRVRVFDPKIHGVRRYDEALGLGAKIGDLDLTALVASEVKYAYESGLMQGPFHYDPAQMHDVAMQLRNVHKVPCVEFPQGQMRLEADTFLWKLFNEGRIDIMPGVLVDHVKSANAKEYENEQVRIIKGTASEIKKVDAAVALSMACWKASKQVTRKKGLPRSTSGSTL